MSTETKTKLTSRRILEKLDQDPNSWTPEEKAKLNAWLSSWSAFLPKKLRRLGEKLQVLLSICLVLPYHAFRVALYALFVLIPSLIAKVSVATWKKAIRNDTEQN